MTTSAPSIVVTPSHVGSKRLISLDLFRGATIAGMIVVNNGGNDATYWPLKHAEWNGWTPTDLVFPFFLFIVGVSIVFSFQARLARGDSRVSLMLHAVRRSVTIFLIGLFLNAFPYFHIATWRIPGVLQRIAVAYLIAAVLTLYTTTYVRIACVAGFLIGYWVLMRYMPVPGFGVPGRDIPLLDPDANLVAWLDRKLMMGHLYEGTRDPEGLLSTLPAFATALLGVLTGEWLRSPRSSRQKMTGMFLAGGIGIGAGELWNLWFPINKKLWTSSYVLFAAGMALVCLAVCYWVMDIREWNGAWTKPFLIFGSNAIAAYVISEVLGIAGSAFHVRGDHHQFINYQQYVFRNIFASIHPAGLASLAYSLSFLFLCFLPVWWMYRRKIFLKV